MSNQNTSSNNSCSTGSQKVHLDRFKFEVAK